MRTRARNNQALKRPPTNTKTSFVFTTIRLSIVIPYCYRYRYLVSYLDNYWTNHALEIKWLIRDFFPIIGTITLSTVHTGRKHKISVMFVNGHLVYVYTYGPWPIMTFFSFTITNNDFSVSLTAFSCSSFYLLLGLRLFDRHVCNVSGQFLPGGFLKLNKWFVRTNKYEIRTVWRR